MTRRLAVYVGQNQIPLIISRNVRRCSDSAGIKSFSVKSFRELSELLGFSEEVCQEEVCQEEGRKVWEYQEQKYWRVVRPAADGQEQDIGRHGDEYGDCMDCACPSEIALTCGQRRLSENSCNVYASAMAGMMMGEAVLTALMGR